MPVTPDALIQRLMEVYDAPSREALARELDIPLRTIQRIAAGKGTTFARTVDLLDRAGYLKGEEDLEAAVQGPRDPLEAIAVSQRSLLRGQRELLVLLQGLLETRPAPESGLRPPPQDPPRSFSSA